ncbi:hypothetical protein BOTCAL_0048g00090 [Botryotinia calthae]|uniref:Uncharacterized protein n=1 Tax=Botryotinia calthae TaxID=38488 RepID=A0A4Y8DDL5_9HELO|nr:hypothetical protein BOTCAL_0048g00090 [Botryotinia calthae]
MSRNPDDQRVWQALQPKKFVQCCACNYSDFSPADVTIPSQGCTPHGVMCLGCLSDYLDEWIGLDGDPQSTFNPEDTRFTTVESTLLRCLLGEHTHFIDVDTVRKYARPKTFAREHREWHTNETCAEADADAEIAAARTAPKTVEVSQQQLQEAQTEVRRLKRRISEMENASANEEAESVV